MLSKVIYKTHLTVYTHNNVWKNTNDIVQIKAIYLMHWIFQYSSCLEECFDICM